MEYELAVIGGGAVGCATAYHAAKAGKRVVLLEQFEIGHNRGSSHGASRIIRHSYTSAAYASLAPAAFELWRNLERESGQALLTMTGGIDIGRATNPAMAACREALTKAEIGSIWLESGAAREAFPQFMLRDDDAVLWQSGAGILNADRCVAAVANEARRHGAVVLERTRVKEVRPGPEVVVAFEGPAGAGELRVESVVLAAGPWAGRFFAALGLSNELRVTHQQVAYYPVEEPGLWEVGRCPVYIVHGRDGFYGFPASERPGFIKVAIETEIPITDPDELPRTADGDTVEALNKIVRARLRGVRPEPAEIVTCRYTETADRDFIIDRHPEYPNVVLASPCSGHGFKFSILTGHLAADLGTSARGPDELEHWRPQFALAKAGTIEEPLAREWRD